MHEGRTGGRIETDAADLRLHGKLAKRRDLDARNVEIHRLAQHVLAFLGNPGGARATAQHVVGGRRAIGRNDTDIVRGAAALVNLPDEIEQARVHAR
ncbi:hypothetical protein D3C73_939040 [compost metagenome]